MPASPTSKLTRRRSALGVNINFGNVRDAFNALIDNVNAHEGINGRKVVPHFVAVKPVGPAPAATARTQLTEDDDVFVVTTPLQAACYLERNVPVVGSCGTVPSRCFSSSLPAPKVPGLERQ